MKNRDTLLYKLKKIKPSLESRFKVHSIALFGSYARGDFNEKSDIDILVDVDPSVGLDFINLAETIEKELGSPVDLVSSRALKPHYNSAIKDECVYV